MSFTQGIILLSLQGNIVYESVGVYPAQTFFAVNRVDGRITVIDNLMNDGFYRSSYTVSHISKKICWKKCFLRYSVHQCKFSGH